MKKTLKITGTIQYQDIEDGRWVGMFREQLAIPGFGHAMLSMFRSGTLGDQSAVYSALERQTIEILVLRGGDDVIMPANHLTQLKNLLPNASYREIPATPHSFVITDPHKLALPVLEFLDQSCGVGRAGV